MLGLIFINVTGVFFHAYDTLFFAALTPIMSTASARVEKTSVAESPISVGKRNRARSIPQVEYSFDVGGRTYRGSRVGINGGFVRHENDAQEIVSELSGGATVQYVAASPSISYVVIDKKHNHYAPILFVLSIVVVMNVILMWSAIKAARQIKHGSYARIVKA